MNLPISDPRLLSLLELEELTPEQTDELLAALEANPEQSRDLDEFLSQMRELDAKIEAPMPTEAQWDSVLENIQKTVAEPDSPTSDAPESSEKPESGTDAEQAPLPEIERGNGLSVVAMVVLGLMVLWSLPTVTPRKPKKAAPADTAVKQNPENKIEDSGEAGGIDPTQIASNDDADEQQDVIVDLKPGSEFIYYPKSHLAEDSSAMTVIWVSKFEPESR